MDSKNTINKLSTPIKKVLTTTLHVNANSTACCIIHQPKAPADLAKFKKMK